MCEADTCGNSPRFFPLLPSAPGVCRQLQFVFDLLYEADPACLEQRIDEQFRWRSAAIFCRIFQ